MRGFTAFVAGLLAVVAFAVVLPLSWLAVEIADEDGYVELSRGILDDADTRTAVVEAVVDELDGRTRERLVEVGIPETLIDQTLQEVAGFVGQGLAADAVVDAWGESQRQAHREMFQGDGQDRGFVVDLAPLVSAVATEAGVDLDVPATLPVESDEPEARRAVSVVAASPQLAVGAGVVTLVGAVVALAAARRRGVALVWLGAGALAVTGVLYVAARALTSADPSAGTDAGTRVGLVLLDVARASFDGLLERAAIGGGVVLLLGVVLAVADAVRRDRDPVAGP
ncbi:hypothetical protein [Aeromicrobium sp.]|uniref:hypothetical protein n=1 Tax=Aeromicrobium sp. TaxID=1871063 RepID=UPI0025C6C91C|nr:hypothetical protein [Aeromicrobium sp.]MCK5891587.1 hypothetical protein [Aeromicrobium sp.]